jgi:hypothetical protein
VTYEIRRPPLPDLVARSAWIDTVDGIRSVCGVAENIGQQPPAVAIVQLRVSDGATVIFLNGADLGHLPVDESREVCFGAPDVPLGPHRLEMTLDEVRLEPEMDETNNRYVADILVRPAPAGGAKPELVGPGRPAAQPDQSTPTPTVVRPAQAGSPKPEVVGPGGPAAQADRPTPTPTAARTRPDLRVSAIRVRGEEPGGQRDCDPGKNDVVVVVKNQGTGAAASFIVQLVVDKQATDKSVATLDAGKETVVRFDDLRLTKGEHRLAATVDAARAISEANEGNNEFEVTVTCKDDA